MLNNRQWFRRGRGWCSPRCRVQPSHPSLALKRYRIAVYPAPVCLRPDSLQTVRRGVSRPTSLKVVEGATGIAHGAAGDNDGWAAGLGQVVHHLQVFVVAVHRQQGIEGQRVAALLELGAGLFVPKGFQIVVGIREF